MLPILGQAINPSPTFSPHNINWQKTFTFASRQALLPLYFEVIKTLPKDALPPRDILLRWAANALAFQKQNEKVFKATAETSQFYASHGLRNYILKGQGNALMYPNPFSRTPGDIDILLDADTATILDFVRKNVDAEDKRFSYVHMYAGYTDGIEIEAHFRPCNLQNFLYNSRLQHWFEEQKEAQLSNIKSITIDEKTYSFAAPTPSFNAIFQLVHIAHHFLSKGIGMRQIVDYYMVLKELANKNIDTAPIIKNLHHFGLYNFAGAVIWVLNDTLALPQHLQIVPPNERIGQALKSEIFIGGNFGSHDNRPSAQQHTSFIGRNIDRLKRDLYVAPYYPSEALTEPFYHLWHFFWHKKYQ